MFLCFSLVLCVAFEYHTRTTNTLESSGTRKTFMSKIFSVAGATNSSSCSHYAKTLWKLIDRLIQDSQFKRAESFLLGPLMMILKFVSENERTQHAKHALAKLERMNSTTLAKGISSVIRAIIRVAMSQAQHSGDLKPALELAKECELYNEEDDEDDEEEDKDVKYSILKTQPKLLDLAKDEILVVVNNELGTIEKSFASMKPMIRQWNRAREWSQEERTCKSMTPHPCGNISKALEIRQVSIFKRMLKMIEILKPLTTGRLVGNSVLDNLLKTLLRMYVMFSRAKSNHLN